MPTINKPQAAEVVKVGDRLLPRYAVVPGKDGEEIVDRLAEHLPEVPRAPVMVSPDLLARHQPREPLTVIAAAATALANLGPVLASAVDGANLQIADQMTTPTMRRTRASAIVDRVAEQATERLNNVGKQLFTAQEELLAAMTPAPGKLSAEIRERLGALPAERRREVLATADASTMAAIIEVRESLWMVGLTDRELEHAEHLFRQRHFPEQVDKLNRVKAAFDDVGRVIDAIEGWRAKAVDRTGLAAAQDRHQRAKAAFGE